jgi:hypothetical protein
MLVDSHRFLVVDGVVIFPLEILEIWRLDCITSKKSYVIVYHETNAFGRHRIKLYAQNECQQITDKKDVE